MELKKICEQLKKGSAELALQNTTTKNKALAAVANALNAKREEILSANKIDIENAKSNGISAALIDRLTLDNKRIDGIIESLNIVISQADPIGEEIAGW